MVRFARAHGSKSSNERQPEEATSWQDLQQQCSAKKDEQTKLKKVDVKEIKARMIKTETAVTEWADLEDPLQIGKKSKKEKKVEKENGAKLGKGKIDKLHKKAHKKIKKQGEKDRKNLTKMLKKLNLTQTKVDLKDTCTRVTKEKKLPEAKSLSKRKKRKEKELMKGSEEYDEMTVSDIANATIVADIGTNYTLTKKQKRRIKHLQNKSKDMKPVINLDVSKPNKPLVLTKRQKRNQKRLADAVDGVKTLVPNNKIHKRRKPDEGSCVMQINGQDVEVAKFNGFPVRKQDADRLNELQQQMIDNDIPIKEITLAMKMERRKAEKAWAREKKNVCFHCRKSGHNLSECPELGNDDTMQEVVPASGICYKCGSTEHTHFECRVNRSQDFRFATCFICKEQGHISNQCPDNPRGLYPKGGACKECGDVTHLKKDCPDLMSKKEEMNVTVSTLNDQLEMLEEDISPNVEQALVKSAVKKVVKF